MNKSKTHFQKYKELLKPPKIGDIVKGKVIQKTRKDIFLDLENFKIGRIKKEELGSSGKDPAKLENGDEIMVKIVGPEDEKGIIEVSVKEAEEELNWRELEELKKRQEKISLKVVGVNRGGLIFNFRGIQGFLPASQLSKEHYPKIEDPTPDKVLEKLKKFLGKEMKVKIINVDSKAHKLVFSEK